MTTNPPNQNKPTLTELLKMRDSLLSKRSAIAGQLANSRNMREQLAQKLLQDYEIDIEKEEDPISLLLQIMETARTDIDAAEQRAAQILKAMERVRA